MCNPAVIGLAVSIGSTAASMLGGADQQAGSAAMARNNAKVLDTKAEDALKRGAVNETIQRQKTAGILGTQRVAMGASGFKVDEGSFGDVLEQTAATGELDALTIRSNAMREAWGHQVEAANYRYQADAAQKQSDFTKTLLTGGGKYNLLNYADPYHRAILKL